jgi:hypothetical protein
MIGSEPPMSLPNHGRHTAAAGGSKVSIASWSRRSMAPSAAIASSGHGAGASTAPSI